MLGGPAGARDRFDPAHPFYATFAELAKIRRATPALWGGTSLVRARTEGAGLFAVSRFDPVNGREVLALFNTSAAPLAAHVEVDPASARFTSLVGPCPTHAAAPGSVSITLPAFGYALCAASPSAPVPVSAKAPKP